MAQQQHVKQPASALGVRTRTSTCLISSMRAVPFLSRISCCLKFETHISPNRIYNIQSQCERNGVYATSRIKQTVPANCFKNEVFCRHRSGINKPSRIETQFKLNKQSKMHHNTWPQFQRLQHVRQQSCYLSPKLLCASFSSAPYG